MKGNIPVSELNPGDEVSVAVVVISVRERRTQQGEPFYLANARNAGGNISIKVLTQATGQDTAFKPGIWEVMGRVETFQNQPQFVVSQYKPITADRYRELQGAEPILPRAFTLDIETIALSEFRERAASKLKKASQFDKMRPDQRERYLEDAIAEEENVYKLGSLAAISGRILSIAVHVGVVAELDNELQPPREHVFGIDENGGEQPEHQALSEFIALISDFNPEVDEIVGHNVISFDLPFIFQRCLVNNIARAPFVNLGEYNPRAVFDTMLRWWLGARNRVSLDDLAWALGLQSSKTEEIEGSRVFDLYHAGRLAEIREYNLNDVRLTRRIYERMIGVWGR